MPTEAAETKNEAQKTKRPQMRDGSTGQYAFQNKWDRLCVCGHKLGCHCAGGFDCFNGDNIEYATGEPCDCRKFRPSRCKAVS